MNPVSQNTRSSKSFWDSNNLYDNDNDRYVVRDVRIGPETVINVYLKLFYRDSTIPYFVPLNLVDDDFRYWVDEEGCIFPIGVKTWQAKQLSSSWYGKRAPGASDSETGSPMPK